MRVFGLAAALGTALASSGDRLPEFRQCVNICVDQCPHHLGLLPFLLWTCEQDCDYLCQQELTAQHKASGQAIHQYHGKWPFIRLMGVQEPASVIFSLLNLAANYYGYGLIEAFDGPMEFYYKLFAVAGINAWIWSSIFHTRDFVFTERLDYFSAIGSIFYGFYLASVRTFALYKYDRQRYLLGWALGLFYLYHIGYLSLVHFDYAYNMMVGVVVGLLQNLLWIAFSITEYSRSGQVADLAPIGLVLTLFAAMSFELFDFSPYGLVFDAHSLWHAGTVIPTYLWYKYMAYDLKKTTQRAKAE